MRRMHHLTLVALGLAGAAIAQGPEQANDQPLAALHRAWITEVLDLDGAGAAAQYAKIAREARTAQPERWVAAARLAELQRLGVITPSAPGLAEGPAALRQALGETPPPALQVDDLLQRLRTTQTTGMPDLTEIQENGLVLRPLVPGAESWLLNQTGPSLRDRRRQRMQAFANLSRSPQFSNDLQRLYATTIVNAEINGRRSQADALRALYFANWRPPVVAGDASTVVRRAIDVLTTWIAEPDLNPWQRTLLTTLREHLERKLESAPEEARNLVARMPRFSERLMASEPTRR